VAIQLRSGRLLVPAYYVELSGKHYADYVFYSDDHGKSWHRGGTVDGPMDECQVVELNDGTVMLNMRSSRRTGRRAISFSKDGGLTWSPLVDDPTLVEPVCQASILRYPDTAGRTRLLFSNPAREKHNDRTHMSVRVSYDEGKTWTVKRLINPGLSAYSCLTVLPDGSIGCLYERGTKRYSDQMTFARFGLDWLESPGE
jgi:sialidase-1